MYRHARDARRFAPAPDHVCNYVSGNRHTPTEGKADMHTEQDRATYYATVSRLTGHSQRYLKVRTAVRVTLSAMAVCIPFASILINK